MPGRPRMVVFDVVGTLMSLQPLQPAMRPGEKPDPGRAATNFGGLTPLRSLLGHLVHRLVLGLTYSALPLS